MTFFELQRRLLANVRDRIQNGELTERGFARSAGISQPHVHNVLKGIKSISIDKTDSILSESQSSVLDLFGSEEISRHLATVSQPAPTFDMPFVTCTLGPGLPWSDGVNSRDTLAVPCSFADSEQARMLVRLGPDFDMEYTSRGFDIVILEPIQEPLDLEEIYAINRGYDTVLRRVRWGSKAVYLVADAHVDQPERWERFECPLPIDFIRGCARWLGSRAGRECRISARSGAAPDLLIGLQDKPGGVGPTEFL